MLRTPFRRVIAVAAVSLSAIAGFATASLGGDRLPVVAAQGEGTYLLSDLTVEFPFGDDAIAGVSWRSELGSSVLPGRVECALEVSDANGDVIGSTLFTYTLIGRSGTSHSPIPVPVQGVPAGASGYCAAADEGRAVQIGQLSVDPTGPQAHLVAEVSWSGERPGEQFCVASLTSSEGTLTELPFTFDPTEVGATEVTLLGGELEGTKPIGLECQPLAGLDIATLEAAVGESK